MALQRSESIQPPETGAGVAGVELDCNVGGARAARLRSVAAAKSGRCTVASPADRTAANSTGLALWLNGDHPELGLNNGAANFAEPSTGSVTNGAWNQIAVTWSQCSNGGAPLFYINGALVGNNDANAFTQALSLINAPALYIGADFATQLTAGGRWFNGDIEEISFYTRALNGSEIAKDSRAATARRNPVRCS